MQTNINQNIKEEIILQAIDLTKYYKCEEEDNIIISLLKRKADIGIKNVSFNIYKNHVMGILGGKKCGKSTLLKILSGIIRPTSGKILYKGSRVTELQLRQTVSYISKEQPCSHEYNCTLFENIIQYACRDNKDRREVVDNAEKLVNDFGMEEYMYKEVIKLPSPIRGKMFIIRGFLSHKQVICFDQPFSFIGEDYKEVFGKYVRDLALSGKTIIITSDEAANVANICDEVINL